MGTGGRNPLSDNTTNAQNAGLQTGESAAAAENRPLTPFEQQQAFVNQVSQGLATGGQQAAQHLPQTIANAAATGQAPVTLTPNTPTTTAPARPPHPRPPHRSPAGDSVATPRA